MSSRLAAIGSSGFPAMGSSLGVRAQICPLGVHGSCFVESDFLENLAQILLELEDMTFPIMKTMPEHLYV